MVSGCDDGDTMQTYYRQLLELGASGELAPLLERALAVIVEATGARIAYLELYADRAGEPAFWRAHGAAGDAVAAIRADISRGIIASTLASGELVDTPSAKDDPRFAERGSVRRNEIDAVLCAPVGTPPIGVVYVQGRADGASFDARHRDCAALFAQQLALVAERVRGVRAPGDDVDHTADVRRRFVSPRLIGKSRALARVLSEAASMAPLDVGVLITGPSGTGKSELARAIHANSRRAGGPFVAVNCAAIPANLVESELFGVERGAHSTATQRTVGKVGAARGGTLFLDEVGELPFDAQAKLLQLLQDRQYYPVGSAQLVTADVRIIAATNVDLRDRVDKQTFRADLYYRLNVVTIEMPGLADRRDDLPDLARHLCRDACARHGLPTLELPRATLAALADEPWPGQVRELANALEAGAIRAAADGATALRPPHVFPTRPTSDDEPDYREATRRFQRRFVLDVLTDCDWDVPTAIARLGIARSHLYNLIAAFELKRPRS